MSIVIFVKFLKLTLVSFRKTLVKIWKLYSVISSSVHFHHCRCAYTLSMCTDSCDLTLYCLPKRFFSSFGVHFFVSFQRDYCTASAHHIELHHDHHVLLTAQQQSLSNTPEKREEPMCELSSFPFPSFSRRRRRQSYQVLKPVCALRLSPFIYISYDKVY